MSTISQNIFKLNYEKKEFDLIKKVTDLLIVKAKKEYGLNFQFGEFKFVVHDKKCQFVSLEPKFRLLDLKRARKTKYPKAIYKKSSSKLKQEVKKDKEL